MAEFYGTNAPDNLIGTDEDDYFYQLGSGNDTVNGGANYDWIPYYSDGGPNGIVVTIDAQGNGTVIDTYGDTDTIISVQAFDGTWQDDVFNFSDGADFFAEGHKGNDTFNLGDVAWGTISYLWLLDYDVVEFAHELDLDIVGVHVDVSAGTVLKYNGEQDTFTHVGNLQFRGTRLDDVFEGADDGLITSFQGMAGNDTIIAGDGRDQIELRREGRDIQGGFTVDLTQGTVTNDVNDDIDTLIGIDGAVGSDFDDVFIGNGDWNYFVGQRGNDKFDGLGGGMDMVAYWGHNRGDVEISGIGTDQLTVEDIGGDWGTDTLTNIETIEFEDGILRIDINATAGQVYRLYQAAYVREPDTAGLEFYINAVDNGLSLPDLADQFVVADEFIEKYGEDLTDEQLIDVIYNNVLHRDADDAGRAFWLDQLAKPNIDSGDLLFFFSESDENVALVAPAIEDGIWL